MTIPVEPLRIGVLGAARIAELSLVGPARATGHRLVAVAARDRSRAETFAAEHDVERVLDSYAELIADPGVEVVYNPLANGLHGPWNLAALAAGKHVLTEKPSASITEEAVEVLDAAGKAGTVCRASSGSCGTSRRSSPFPPRPPRTPAGRCRSPAAPSWTSAATACTPCVRSPPGRAGSPPWSAPGAVGARALLRSTSGWTRTWRSRAAPPVRPAATWTTARSG
ncbi:hypothetical protein GCM10017557_70560 [Streptomyces aurantiacus]|uniref:Gfo/Idh/MocA-like oxidoreductase N-terminal domain-containing protein n=1 Tax=Streptomyces aurantiacus TaxID=47760 RepID=A0A7G1PEM0_9ACTN|nr:hypothetical protein GCM10017557_70560 [Streptomyces aurantiacus]